MKKKYKITGEKLEEILKESVINTVYKILNEGFYDDFNDDFGNYDDEEDSYTNDLLSGIEDYSDSISSPGNSDDDIIAQSEEEEEDDEELDFNMFNDSEKTNTEDSLYKDALEALESSGGDVNFNEWYNGFEGEVSEQEAKSAFEKAVKEYNGNEYETDEIPDFENRAGTVKEEEPTHQEGNIIEYDGVEIKDDGKQFIMIANVDNPKITIKGSSLNDVKKTYNSLWNDMSNMESKARKIGLTNFEGALLWGDDYDKFVRSAGAHNPNYPIIIDLDKIAQKNKTSKPKEQNVLNTNTDWLEPFKHGNGKYMMTNYQTSKLTPEQLAQWEHMKKINPGVYSNYSEIPSEKKANRYKK